MRTVASKFLSLRSHYEKKKQGQNRPSKSTASVAYCGSSQLDHPTEESKEDGVMTGKVVHVRTVRHTERATTTEVRWPRSVWSGVAPRPGERHSLERQPFQQVANGLWLYGRFLHSLVTQHCPSARANRLRRSRERSTHAHVSRAVVGCQTTASNVASYHSECSPLTSSLHFMQSPETMYPIDVDSLWPVWYTVRSVLTPCK